MNPTNKKAFTIIELLIVITIIAILTMLTFVPYNFYSNVWKVRISKEIINQMVNEASLNANSVEDKTTKKNLNLWIKLKEGSGTIDIVSYPYDFTGSLFDGWELFKQVNLEDWVNVNKISFSWSAQDEALIFFKAPDWEMTIYKNSSETWSQIDMIIGYKNAISWVLSKEVNIK